MGADQAWPSTGTLRQHKRLISILAEAATCWQPNPLLERCCQLERMREILALAQPTELAMLSLILWDELSIKDASCLLGIHESTGSHRLRQFRKRVLAQLPEIEPMARGRNIRIRS